jgi:hypothetical protein
MPNITTDRRVDRRLWRCGVMWMGFPIESYVARYVPRPGQPQWPQHFGRLRPSQPRSRGGVSCLFRAAATSETSDPRVQNANRVLVKCKKNRILRDTAQNSHPTKVYGTAAPVIKTSRIAKTFGPLRSVTLFRTDNATQRKSCAISVGLDEARKFMSASRWASSTSQLCPHLTVI